MTSFPVIASTFSANHLVPFLIATFGLGEATTCTLYRTGFNPTLRVTDLEKQYMFRVYSYRWRTKGEIKCRPSALPVDFTLRVHTPHLQSRYRHYIHSA